MRLLRLRYLALSALLLWLLLWGTGRLRPVTEPDTLTYQQFDFSSARAALAQIRTPAYPLFLKATVTPQAATVCQAALYLLACLLFAQGLVRAGYQNSTALLAGLTLMPGRGLIDLAAHVTADSLAISSAIAATGCFLACTGTQTRFRWWLGLVLLTFLTYLIRPAYLFLIPLWPLLGLLLDGCLLRRGSGWKVPLQRLAAFSACALLPFVLWGTLRYLVVGDWGLVSFGGYNIVGVSGQFVDEPLTEQLPADLQPLARKIVAGRKEIENYQPPESIQAMEAMFNPTVWKLAVPAAQELTDGDPVATNRLLSRFSLTVIQLRWTSYLKWLTWNANHARIEITRLTAYDKGTLLLGLLILAAHALALLKPRRVPESALACPGESQVLFWVALGFVCAKTLLVILVEPANGRYMTGASCLLPAVLAVWTAQLLRTLRGGQEPAHTVYNN